MLIKSDLNYQEIKNDVVAPNDSITEWCAAEIQVPGRNQMRFINLYVPPITNAPDDTRQETFDPSAIRVTKNTFLAGDYNAHAASWDPFQPEDARGTKLEDWCDDSGFIAANSGHHTRINRATGGKSTPDITFHHGTWAGSIEWAAIDDPNCSDHLPIIWTIPSKTICPRRKAAKYSMKRANWDTFVANTEDKFRDLGNNFPPTLKQAYSDFKDIVQKGMKQAIPKGRIIRPKAWWNEKAEKLKEERETLRKDAEQHPDDREKQKAYNAASKRTLKETNMLKAEAYREKASKLDPRKSSKEVFSLIRNIDGRSKGEHPSTPLEYGSSKLCTDKAKAEAFVLQYARVSEKPKVSVQEKRNIRPALNKLKTKCSCEVPGSENSSCQSFSTAELNQALGKLRLGKTPGCDEITNEVLRRLGPAGKNALLKIFNLSWHTKAVPNEWKKAKIIPILKTAKPPEKITSYRPISLTSCVAKLMERLVQTRMSHLLETNNAINSCQAGFRSLHSTEDQCIRITQSIANGFHSKPMKRTLLVLIDFQRAFDTVWRHGLLKKLMDMPLPKCYVKWCKAFLTDRLAKVSYGAAESRWRPFMAGLPQGAVLSPILFLCFINDISKELPEGANISLFADDLAVWVQETKLSDAENTMQKALDVIEHWSNTWKMKINADKTETTFFSAWTKEASYRPTLSILGKRIGYNATPTFLGLTFDRQLTFKTHIAKIKQRMKNRAKTLGALKGRTWGCWKDDVRLLYLSYVRSSADYCASAWAPSASKSTMNSIEVAQNSALRTITGCTVNTPIESLQIEANVEPYQKRADFLVATSYEKALRLPKDNPRFIATTNPVPLRTQKQTWCDTAAKIVNQTELANLEREPMHANAAKPPWVFESCAKFNEELNESCRRTEPIESKLLKAERTIDSLSGATFDIYTDGSAVNSNRNGGAGAWIRDNRTGRSVDLKAPAGKLTCSYRAELVAINKALGYLIEESEAGRMELVGRANLYTDSKSAIQKLATGRLQQNAIAKMIWAKLDKISTISTLEITFQWIPGHSNVEGNERVDALAKEATTLTQDEEPVDYNCAKAEINTHLRKTWLKSAKPKIPGAVYVPQRKQEGLSKGEQTILSRLRTGGYMPQLAWYRWFVTRKSNQPESATCVACGMEDEDVSHLMSRCPAHERTRLNLFGSRDPISTLFDAPKLAVEYLRRTGIISGRI